MKKLFLSFIGIVVPFLTFAEGYQVNTLSAKQGGMAHTGVALKLGSESMYFNPAGMGFMDKTLDLSGSLNAVMPTAKAKHDGKWYETDNKVSTPMMLSAAFSIYDNLKAGITLYTPYGSNINWGDNWPGAILNQKVSLTTFTIQPTLAWRITPKLSVGAGLMIAWGNVDLYKGLVVPGTLDKMLQAMGMQYAFGNTTPASVNLTGTANLALGVNVGVMYDIDSRWTVGVNFRSKMSMKVKKGDASIIYANEVAQNVLGETLNVLNTANFAAEMPMPAVLTFGVSFKPIETLTLAFDAQMTGWKTYKHLNIDFLDEKLTAYNQSLTKKYKNAWAFRLGAQYALTNRFDVRAGLIVDMTPVNDEHYNPETPGMTKIEPSIGFSFRPIDNLSIDFSMMYVAGLGKNGAKCTYEDLLAKTAQGLLGGYEKTFEADYRVNAYVPSIGVSYSF
ncbi:MAG: outer membrane protein transport protein [Muribaculum sp.]|nr:outer membrane protein transport protein [Muribaculum sp.]